MNDSFVRPCCEDFELKLLHPAMVWLSPETVREGDAISECAIPPLITLNGSDMRLVQGLSLCRSAGEIESLIACIKLPRCIKFRKS
jgi:hypothetical protein